MTKDQRLEWVAQFLFDSMTDSVNGTPLVLRGGYEQARAAGYDRSKRQWQQDRTDVLGRLTSPPAVAESVTVAMAGLLKASLAATDPAEVCATTVASVLLRAVKLADELAGEAKAEEAARGGYIGRDELARWLDGDGADSGWTIGADGKIVEPTPEARVAALERSQRRIGAHLEVARREAGVEPEPARPEIEVSALGR